MRGWRAAAPLVVAGLVVGIMTGALAGCAADITTSTQTRANDRVDGYVALVPNTLRAGETASFSFTLWNGRKPADTAVQVTVMNKDKNVLASAQGSVDGKGTLELAVPRVAAGDYTVKVAGNGFSESTPVQIEPGTLLFLESDKPIYKPGRPSTCGWWPWTPN